MLLARVWILDNPSYFMQFLLAGIIFALIFVWVRQDFYSGLALIVLVFTSLYYEEFLYSVVGGIAYLLLLSSLLYLDKGWKEVLLGVLIGGFSIGVSMINPFFA